MVCAGCESIRSDVVSWSTTVVEATQNCYNVVAGQVATAAEAVVPQAELLAMRVQSAWAQALVDAQPYLQTAREVMFSPLGVAAALLTGAIVCMYAARQTDNRVVGVALVAIGMTACLGSGIFLGQSGMLPLVMA